MKNKWNLRTVIRAEKIRPDGTVPLYWEASINKQEMKFSSQKWVALKYWDSNKKLVKKGCGYSAVMNGYIKKTFEDITYELVQRWDYYLKTVRKNTINGRFNRHKCFNAIIKEAILQGHMVQTPYIHFKVRQQESKRQFLTIDEVKMLRRLRLPRERKSFKGRLICSFSHALQVCDILTWCA